MTRHGWGHRPCVVLRTTSKMRTYMKRFPGLWRFGEHSQHLAFRKTPGVWRFRDLSRPLVFRKDFPASDVTENFQSLRHSGSCSPDLWRFGELPRPLPVRKIHGVFGIRGTAHPTFGVSESSPGFSCFDYLFHLRVAPSRPRHILKVGASSCAKKCSRNIQNILKTDYGGIRPRNPLWI